MMKKINIAIDGPSAAGKSTIAKRLAKILQYSHLDTGAMYRCCALKAKKLGLRADDEQGIVKMLKHTSIQVLPDGTVYLDGTDVSSDIREQDISMLASTISKLPLVRAELVFQQQQMAKEKGFILDGRDIGSVVLPDAELKIFQTASVETRAQRRYLENMQRGISCSLDEIAEDIRLRDEQDSNRAASPLRQVEDAIVLDTSDSTIEEAVQEIVELVDKILK